MNDIDDDLDVNDFEAAEEINLLRAEVASLKEEAQISELAREGMELILNRFVELLHGGEPPNGLHSWHALPYIAEKRINDLTQQLASLKEQNALLAQASVAVQEPVMYQRYSMGIGWVEVSYDDIEFYKGRGQKIRALYASNTLDKESK